MPEEVSVTFDPEVDLSDDAVGRSRYERFYSVRSNYARENLSLRRRSREPRRGCLWRNFRICIYIYIYIIALNTCDVTKSIKHISKNSPNSSKIHNYIRRAHVLRHVK